MPLATLLIMSSNGPVVSSRLRKASILSRRGLCANTAGSLTSRRANKPLPDFPRCSLIRRATSQGWVTSLSLPSSKTRESFSYRTLAVTTLLLFSTTPPALTYWRAPLSLTATSLRLHRRRRLQRRLRLQLHLQPQRHLRLQRHLQLH